MTEPGPGPTGGEAPARVPVVCGIDVGSTNLKVVCLDGRGSVVARGHRPTPRLDDGTVDASVLHHGVESMIIEACGDVYTIVAACTAGVGEDGVLVDDEFAPLCTALPWFAPVRRRILRDIAERLEPAPALPVDTDAARTIVGWEWARAAADGRARAWLSLTDYVAARWAGRAFMSDTIAARTAAWVPADGGCWLTSRVSATLGSPQLLPDVVPAGAVVGRLGSDRLRRSGVLAPDAAVVVGGHDHPVGAWGVVQVFPGAILDSMGTAEVIVAQLPELPARRPDGIDLAPGILGSGGTLLVVHELARNVEWASTDPAVARAIRDIVSGVEQPDAFLASEVFVPGAAGGTPPAFGSDAPHDPRSRASAVLGSLARTGAGSVRDMAALAPRAPVLVAAGGWARSPGWMAIKNAVTGTDMAVLAEAEVTAVGAALLAARAIDRPVSARVALAV